MFQPGLQLLLAHLRELLRRPGRQPRPELAGLHLDLLHRRRGRPPLGRGAEEEEQTGGGLVRVPARHHLHPPVRGGRGEADRQLRGREDDLLCAGGDGRAQQHEGVEVEAGEGVAGLHGSGGVGVRAEEEAGAAQGGELQGGGLGVARGDQLEAAQRAQLLHHRVTHHLTVHNHRGERRTDTGHRRGEVTLK